MFIFLVDRIFDENATLHEVFDTVVKPIVAETLKGINGTIFAYGQTSSGKTNLQEINNFSCQHISDTKITFHFFLIYFCFSMSRWKI